MLTSLIALASIGACLAGWFVAAAQMLRADRAERLNESIEAAPTGMFFLERPSLGTLDEWIEANEDDRPAMVHLVRALRVMGAEGRPITGVGMVDLAPVRGDDVFELVRLGVLREATPAECRSAGAERWHPEIDELPGDPDEGSE